MTDNSSINRQASAWVAKLHGQYSQEDLQRFRHWMAQSPAHQAEMKSVATLWGELDILTELAVPSPQKAANQSMSASILAGFGRLFTQPTYSNHSSQYRTPAIAFASVVFIAVISVTAMLGLDRNHYSTDIGDQQMITLNDGSTVLLNTNSEIRVEYHDEGRDIQLLQGQAHFDVMPNKSLPFTVYAGEGQVRAVGTAFSVYLQPEVLEVMVTEGVIELSTLKAADLDRELDRDLSKGLSKELNEEPNQEENGESSPQPNNSNKPQAPKQATKLSLVEAGQNVQLDQRSQTIQSLETIEASVLVQKLAWHQGLLRFSGDPLETVVAEVSRYTELKITIQDPTIRNLRIGGFFKVGETDKMLQALETSFGIRVQRLDNNIVHLTAAAAGPGEH
ncbi:FecR domain-containing protein [Porticoccaceae bacterium]|nr:FecR domain-containing protein [Porticoccaceae bacterium]